MYSDQQWNHSISVTSVKKGSNPNVPLRVATQILIYEIVCGLRDPSSFNRNSSNECGTSGDVFYNAAAASVSGFTSCYNSLVSAIQAAKKIPSFCGSSSSNAPTIQLSGDTGSAYDSNGVLSAFSFSNGNGARFSKSGNTLNITKTGDISESTVFTATRYLPSASNSSYNIWYMSGSSYQTTISLYNAGSNGLNAYFKIKAPSLGNISLTKTTEDGKNLSGWQFGIYSNATCTNLVSGPYTTNSSGNLSVTGLNAGAYYVKELGNTDSGLDTLYSCASTNPQKVTIVSGQTASVSFYNKCSTGSVTLVKQTNTGENLGGWKIGLYYDPDCANPIPDSPFVTGADGTVTVSGLQPGILYAREIPTGDPYWEFDTEVKAVTIQVNQTASITFTNTQYGRIQIVKTTNTGSHLGGWTFQVRDSSGKTVGEFTTDESGYAITGNLPLGRYTVMELPTEDVYWIGELGFHTVLVTGGKDAVDTWLNKEQGIGWFYKKTNTGENVEGWKITIYSDPACTQEVGTITTNEEGRGGYFLDPGIYYAKETGDEYGRFEDEYWMVDESVQKVEILPHQDTEITFTNVQYGKLKILKTMEDGTTAAGWQFRVTDAAGAEVEGSSFVTSEDGTILETLLPGEYTVEEILPEDSLYVCKSENPQKVSVVQGQIAEVTFINGIRTGRITVHNKTDNYFVKANLNQDEGVYYVTGHTANKEDATHFVPVKTGDTKGRILIKGLEDGTYSMTEVRTDSGYVLLKQDIEVVISQKESADSCTVYASDTLGLIQNDPRYAKVIQSDSDLKNIPQKHLEHKLLTVSATVSGKKVNMAEDNGSTNAEAPLTVVNTRGFDLPKTGDNGTMMFTIVGILLMVGAAVVLYAVSSKKSA